MTYNARDLLTDVAADDEIWTGIGEPTMLVAAVEPLAEVACVLADQSMLQHLRLLAAVHGVHDQVEWEQTPDEREVTTPMPMRVVVPLLREAGQTRDAVRLLDLPLPRSSLDALPRCGQLLASAALALGQLRICRLYVLAARTMHRACRGDAVRHSTLSPARPVTGGSVEGAAINAEIAELEAEREAIDAAMRAG